MDFKSEIEKYKKFTFEPIVSNNSDSNETLLDSKFGGKPFVSNAYPWPKCGECEELMAFFLQLNSNDLPSKLEKENVFGEGILQFFYCIKCDNYEPFGKNQMLRIIKPSDFNTDTVLNDLENNFEYRKIIDWNELIDYPKVDEILESLDLNTDETEKYENEYKTKDGEKLLGWPLWIQNIEYPDCPICSKQMRFIFQVDSERNIDYMFGDMGVGHISQCEDHPEQITFTWACC